MKIRSPVVIWLVLFGPKCVNHDPAELVVEPTGKWKWSEQFPDARTVQSIVGIFGLLPCAMIPKSEPHDSCWSGAKRGTSDADSKPNERVTPPVPFVLNVEP